MNITDHFKLTNFDVIIEEADKKNIGKFLMKIFNIILIQFCLFIG